MAVPRRNGVKELILRRSHSFALEIESYLKALDNDRDLR